MPWTLETEVRYLQVQQRAGEVKTGTGTTATTTTCEEEQEDGK